MHSLIPGTLYRSRVSTSRGKVLGCARAFHGGSTFEGEITVIIAYTGTPLLPATPYRATVGNITLFIWFVVQNFSLRLELDCGNGLPKFSEPRRQTPFQTVQGCMHSLCRYITFHSAFWESFQYTCSPTSTSTERSVLFSTLLSHCGKSFSYIDTDFRLIVIIICSRYSAFK
jgi:hypothetical protein